MTLTAYKDEHGVNVRKLAADTGVTVSTVYRWLKWEAGEEGGSRPDADQIVAIQRAAGGMVTVVNWTAEARSARLGSSSVPSREPTATC